MANSLGHHVPSFGVAPDTCQIQQEIVRHLNTAVFTDPVDVRDDLWAVVADAPGSHSRVPVPEFLSFSSAGRFYSSSRCSTASINLWPYHRSLKLGCNSRFSLFAFKNCRLHTPSSFVDTNV